jgi:predicted nucleic acid-binding protein
VTDVFLDTSFFIDLYHGGSSGADHLWSEVESQNITAGVSPISVYELWVAQRLERTEELFYEAMLAALEEVPLSGYAARLAAGWLRTQGSRSEALFRDALIAASATEVGARVATANDRDFSHFPQVVVQNYR